MTRPTIADAVHDPYWCCTFDEALRELVRRGRPFSADDVRDLGVPEPSTAAQWGAAFRTAAARGRIRPTGFAAARHPEARGRVLRLWVGARP